MIRINSKKIGYAGTKDARAITVQMLTLESVKPSSILLAKDELKKSGLYVGNYK
jgi:tRNA pseudouridine13 synthase